MRTCLTERATRSLPPASRLGARVGEDSDWDQATPPTSACASHVWDQPLPHRQVASVKSPGKAAWMGRLSQAGTYWWGTIEGVRRRGHRRRLELVRTLIDGGSGACADEVERWERGWESLRETTACPATGNRHSACYWSHVWWPSAVHIFYLFFPKSYMVVSVNGCFSVLGCALYFHYSPIIIKQHYNSVK
jgi:hypothetical protein